MAELTDEDLAKRVQDGDNQWFAILVGRYESKLSRYGRKFLLSEEEMSDLLQDIFLKAYENIQDFDPKRRFSPWLYRIAHNHFINYLKKRQGQPINLFDTDVLIPHETEPEPFMGMENMKELLDKCLDQIDAKYREPLVLHYYEDMDYKKISEILRIPVSTVGVRLKRGREYLRKIVEENGKQK